MKSNQANRNRSVEKRRNDAVIRKNGGSKVTTIRKDPVNTRMLHPETEIEAANNKPLGNNLPS